jgi:hypothetical protein
MSYHDGFIRMMTALVAVAATAAPLAASTIHLLDGRVMEGEVVPGAQPTTVGIRLVSASYVAVIEVPRAEIRSIEFEAGPHERALADVLSGQRQLDADPGASAGAYLALATRAAAIGEDTLGRRLAQEVLARDGANAEAHRMLDEIQINGVWLSLPEAMQARGLVFFQNRWMTPAEAEALRQAAQEELQRQQRAPAQPAATPPGGPALGGLDATLDGDAGGAQEPDGDAGPSGWWSGALWILPRAGHHHGAAPGRVGGGRGGWR